jgi:hypothetical protein
MCVLAVRALPVLSASQLDPRVRRRRPRSRPLSSRAISRSASRWAIACRLSKDRRPRARISTFAQPFWKYSDNGTRVTPASPSLAMILSISPRLDRARPRCLAEMEHEPGC